MPERGKLEGGEAGLSWVELEVPVDGASRGLKRQWYTEVGVRSGAENPDETGHQLVGRNDPT